MPLRSRAVSAPSSRKALPAESDDEDVHAYVERELIALIGDAGRRLHTGRSRNEQVAVDLRLYLKRCLPVVQRDLVAVAEALLNLAARAGGALMPSYTHLRKAQPVLVAHFLLAHVSALRRDHERLASVIARGRRTPTGIGRDRGNELRHRCPRARRGAGLLARSRATAWTSAAIETSSRRFSTPPRSAMVHLSRLSEDFILFTSEEFAFFDLADAAATGSSLMPQKKNPDPLELVRGKAGRVIGHLTGWLATMKSLPSGYSKDLQEDKEALFDAEDTWRARWRRSRASSTA